MKFITYVVHSHVVDCLGAYTTLDNISYLLHLHSLRLRYWRGQLPSAPQCNLLNVPCTSFCPWCGTNNYTPQPEVGLVTIWIPGLHVIRHGTPKELHIDAMWMSGAVALRTGCHTVMLTFC